MLCFTCDLLLCDKGLTMLFPLTDLLQLTDQLIFLLSINFFSICIYQCGRRRIYSGNVHGSRVCCFFSVHSVCAYLSCTFPCNGHCSTYMCDIYYNFLWPHFRYQKSSDVMKGVGEKTSFLFGGIGGKLSAKLGEVKESTAFKSFEERVGTAVGSVKVIKRSSLTF